MNAPPGSPSILGCSQAQELGLISVHMDEVQKQSKAAVSALTRANVLRDYKDCFDKIGCFPGEKYHIQLIENPKPVIHPPRSVPVHVLPLYKAELEKMEAGDIITKVTDPMDWVNSITCKITKTKDGTPKLRLCLDPREI